ncbi:SusD/RagB family nutrient-binding outer membrane lipoprotein [Pontibacter qinzhouensis]|uniref:SusD/RagB family nutrient-binding outer membrane lipoprotein n=1 Tax=Pontibacter qinzhouensis TaxID=2603253 RepID=A0A5C8K775_9BACT|nr:SusD/RagB family nutrient-binding outer membrane lipoprotein [Pontibacter qinzhouensis]TXK48074.1 SusD/RagB family nutrient-binding outer membrane lipoprotein [Pontibacter qinzhouensis]
MTTIKKFSFLLLALLGCLGFSCTDDFEEINTDPNRIDKISPGTLLNPIIYEMASFNTSRSDNFTFNLMQVALPYPSVAGGVHRYDVNENAGNSTWNTYYRWLSNIKEMRAAAGASSDPNYEAIALTLNAWTYSLLTDSFGDVPMEEAVRGDEQIFRPAFNTQQEVYTKILGDLETANRLFDTTRPMIYGTDILFNNSVASWRRFCNSLRMRLLLRVSKRTEMNAMAHLAEMVSKPEEYPVFTSNEQAAILKITGIAPNVSPWGRAIDFTTFRAAASFFVDNLVAFNDPRLPRFTTQARSSDGQSTIGYKGIPSGYNGSDSQFDYLPSNVNIALVTAPMISVIMTYAEVEFIKAELALAGVITADAKAHYENGVKAAVEQWGLTLPATYFENPATAFDNTLERLMLQKYYALYFNDYQQWFEYRRTGLPVLPKGEDLLNNGMMPVRFRYPTTVVTNNNANYKKALESMGTDDINTKVWWER